MIIKLSVVRKRMIIMEKTVNDDVGDDKDDEW